MTVRQYAINGEFWPQPDSTVWTDIPAGTQLSTALPIYSVYRQHTWNMPILPNCDYAALLEAIRNTELVSLTTDSPGDAEELTTYTDVKVMNISNTHSWGHPRGISIEFLVYCP